MRQATQHGGRSRREFLTAALAGGLAASVGGTSDSRRVSARALPLDYDAEGIRVLFESSFEPGQHTVALKHHEVVDDAARSGKHSLRGEVDAPDKACFLEIPFEAPKDSALYVSFWVRSEKGSACAAFIRTDEERIRLSRVDKTPVSKWQQVQASHQIDKDLKGVIQIVAPSSYGAPAGRAWVDDVTVAIEKLEPLDWPEHAQDFPALTTDGRGRVWMAKLERRLAHPCISLQRGMNGAVEGPIRLEVGGALGMGAPAVCGKAEGCAVAFPVEGEDGLWRIAYAFVDEARAGDVRPSVLDCPGTANVGPCLATMGSRACLVWESNGGDARGVHACWVDEKGAGIVERISSPDANSYNPAVVALPDGSLFAAWDSLRNDSADLYGAWFRNGRWEAEQRLTSAARIERHPVLAARDGAVWMAWQAQSYPNEKLNNVNEQRVVVARVGAGGLRAPMGLFEHVSTPGRLLLRPQIAFDERGRLWLTARQSLGLHSGWLALTWRYDGAAWSKPKRIVHQQGRWRPVSLVATSEGLIAAAQFDDLVQNWEQRGVHSGWKSGVFVKMLDSENSQLATTLQTESLAMPPTEFSLTEKITLCGADLPRLRWQRGGEELMLLWGDLHDHTDISVCNRRMNPPGHDLFANVRDIERLDFCALTDHGYNFDAAQWALNGEQTRYNHDPGRFVTFLGEEWTSSKNPPAEEGEPNRYGHHNLIFLDPYHKSFYDSYDGDISPVDLWRQLEGVDYVCIPHQLADWKGKGKGNPPTDWSYVDERLQPVAEIYQARQSYEYLGCPRQSPTGAPFKGYYLQDAWAQGIIIGVIGSPDHGGGSGKAGVWAKELTREAIFEAVRARHTFGTSGPKMALRFSAGEAMMGDRVARPAGGIGFRVSGVATRKIREMVIFRNNEIVHRVEPGRTEFEVAWEDTAPPREPLLWYYARIHAEDDGLAWSSPIWFEG